MILNLSGGGSSGAALNFKVVGGTSAPANPSENTIWVNTDTPFNAWEFSAENPADVWAVETAGSKVLCTLSGRTYSKVNAGKAVFTITKLEGSNWAPFLVSTDPNAVATTTSYKPDEIRTYQGSVQYKGVTYYYCFANYSYAGTYSVTPMYAKSISVADLAMYLAEKYEASENGMVWIRTGDGGTAEFNALKKNGIQVSPVSAKQIVDGVWVDKTIKIYQGGAWAEFTKYIFKQGSGSLETLNPKIDADNITVTADGIIFNGNTSKSLLATEAKDISLYEGVAIEYVCSANSNGTAGFEASLAMSTSNNVNTSGYGSFASSIRIPVSSGKTTVKLPFNGQTGNYYMYIVGAFTGTVYNWYLY